MTKKDYIILARAFSDSRPINRFVDTVAFAQWEKDINAVAKEAHADNPRFDRGRFLVAAMRGAEE